MSMYEITAKVDFRHFIPRMNYYAGKVEYSIENDDVRRLIYEALAADGVFTKGAPDVKESGAFGQSIRGVDEYIGTWKNRIRVSGFRIDGVGAKMTIHIDPYEIRNGKDFHYAQVIQDRYNWQPISDVTQRDYNSSEWQDVKNVIIKVVKGKK